MHKQLIFFQALLCLSLFLGACASSGKVESSIDEKKRYTVSELKNDGLMQSSETEFVEYRIIYPRIARIPKYRKLFTLFLQNLPEVQFFDDIVIDEQDLNQNVKYVLEVYPYEQANRNDIYSLAIETKQSSSVTKKVQRWRTLNLLLKSQRQLHFEDFFLQENRAEVEKILIDYLREDIIRQKQAKDIEVLSDVFVKQDENFYWELLKNYTLIPHPTSSSFVGFRIYIGQYIIGTESEGSYTVNIPSSTFYKHLSEKYRPYFVQQKMLFPIDDPAKIFSAFYPDLNEI